MRLLLFTAVFLIELASTVFAQSEWKPLPTGVIERVAFGLCAKHWQPQPIWQAVIAKKPDVWLFLGDSIYADTDGMTAWSVSKDQLAGEWNRLADKPEFQRARSHIPMMATWDNHDFGSHAGGSEFPLKRDSKEVFLNFFGEPTDSLQWKRSGVYDSKSFGPPGRTLQIILLDTKYNRSAFLKSSLPKKERLQAGIVGGYKPDSDHAKTHLGQEQWKWLESELRKPADLRLICSSTQIIPNQKAMDEWGNFPHERRRFFELIRDTNANGVILLSGKVHFAEISCITNGVPYPLYELTSSGMTHTEALYANAPNAYRVDGPSADLNFGLLEINWGESTVRMSACNADEVTLFAKQVSFSPRATLIDD